MSKGDLASKPELISAVDVPPPWLARVAMIKEAAAYNVDTERKVTRLSEELRDMLREIKIRVSGFPWLSLICRTDVRNRINRYKNLESKSKLLKGDSK